MNNRQSETTIEDVVERIISKGLMIWRAIAGVSIALFISIGFIFSMKGDIRATRDKAEKHDADILEIKSNDKDFFTKSEANQVKILEAINQLRIEMKDKADRKK